MSKQLKYGIVVVFVLFAAGMVWLFSGGTESARQTKSTVKYNYISSNWKDKYGWESKDPYGLYLFTKDLKKKLKNQKQLYTIATMDQFDVQMEKQQNATYLFIGDELGLYEEEIDSLFTQVADLGSDLFVITPKMSDYFIEPYELTFDYAPKTEVESQYADYPMVFLYQNDTLAHEWTVFKKYKDEDIDSKVLTTINSHPNFIKADWGQGKVFINTTPEGLLNFQLVRPETKGYANEIIKHISADKPLYVLDLARLKERDPYDPFKEFNNKKGKKDDSYLQLLFNTPALRSALFLALIGIILFIIFRAKRMRPLIPGVPEKRNMSKIFVQTMASIYHTKNNPSTVLKIHRRNFFDTVQKHFFIDLSKRTDEHGLKSLAEKSGFALPKLEKLVEQLEAKKNVDELHLFNTISAKREFYELSGIIPEKTQLRIDQQKVELYKSIWLVFPLLLLGLLVGFFGLYLLVKANSIGILLMILGAAVFLLCARWMSIPVLRFDKDNWQVTSIFSRKTVFKTDDILRVEKSTYGFIIHLKNERKVVLQLQNVDEHKLKIISTYLHKLFNVEL